MAPDGLSWCDVCQGKRWLRPDVPVGHPHFGQLVPCSACGVVAHHRVARFDAVSSRRGRALHQRFSNFSLEGPAAAATEAFNAALLFARNPDRRWLVMYGPSGNGKSHLAAAIANYLIEEQQMATLFLTTPDFLQALRETLNERGVGDGYSAMLDIACEAPVLILDDLGAERGTEWVEEVLFIVLDRRYRLLLPTVVITNCGLRELPPRLYSRLNDRSLCTVVFNPAPDYRVGDGSVTA